MLEIKPAIQMSPGDLVILKGCSKNDERNYYIVVSTFTTKDIWGTKVYDAAETICVSDFDKKTFCQVDLDLVHRCI